MPDRMAATMRYRPSSSKSTQVGRSMISTVLLKARLWCGVVRPCNPGIRVYRNEGLDSLSMVGRQSTLPLASTSKWVAIIAAVHVARGTKSRHMSGGKALPVQSQCRGAGTCTDIRMCR